MGNAKKPAQKLTRILDLLEKEYGRQKFNEPTDPFQMVMYRNAGYPQSDTNCARGFAALKSQIGLNPTDILRAKDADLRAAAGAGGMMPEARAERWKEIAVRVERESGGDLGAVMKRGAAEAKKALKKFPTIADATAEKILLFTRTAPVAALPSNCLDVPLRLGYGREQKNWAASYRSAQEAVAAELPEEFDARMRLYLLLKRLGQEVCKRSRPLCEECVVTHECAYFARTRGGKRDA